jgi:hypothetical protein
MLIRAGSWLPAPANFLKTQMDPEREREDRAKAALHLQFDMVHTGWLPLSISQAHTLNPFFFSFSVLLSPVQAGSTLSAEDESMLDEIESHHDSVVLSSVASSPTCTHDSPLPSPSWHQTSSQPPSHNKQPVSHSFGRAHPYGVSAHSRRGSDSSGSSSGFNSPALSPMLAALSMSASTVPPLVDADGFALPHSRSRTGSASSSMSSSVSSSSSSLVVPSSLHVPPAAAFSVSTHEDGPHGHTMVMLVDRGSGNLTMDASRLRTSSISARSTVANQPGSVLGMLWWWVFLHICFQRACASLPHMASLSSSITCCSFSASVYLVRQACSSPRARHLLPLSQLCLRLACMASRWPIITRLYHPHRPPCRPICLSCRYYLLPHLLNLQPHSNDCLRGWSPNRMSMSMMITLICWVTVTTLWT